MVNATVRRDTAIASRGYLWIWCTTIVVLGVGSLVVNPDFATGQDVTVGHLFGVIETNGWHGLAALLSGIVGLAFARSPRWAPRVAVGIGLVTGVVPAAVFFAFGDGSIALGLVPVEYFDVLTLHLVPGVIGIACGLAGLADKRSLGRFRAAAAAAIGC